MEHKQLSDKFIDIIDEPMYTYEIGMYVVRFPNEVPDSVNTIYSLSNFTDKAWDYVGIVPINTSGEPSVGFNMYEAVKDFDISNFKDTSNYNLIESIDAPELNTLYLFNNLDSFIKFHDIKGDKDSSGRGDAFFIIRLKR